MHAAIKPTKKQLRKLTSLSEGTDEDSAYVMLHNGLALACLYADGKTKHVVVERNGALVSGNHISIPLGTPR